MSDDLELVECDRMRARRAPRALLALYASHAAWSLLAALPVREHASRTFGAHPDGDAVLFTPGGRALMEWAAHETHGVLLTAAPLAIAIAIVGAVATQLATANLLLAMTHGRAGLPPRPGEGAAFASRAFLPLTAVWVLTLLAQGIVLGGGGFAAGALYDALVPSGDARAFFWGVAALAPFVVLAALVGVTADLARAALSVREREDLSRVGAIRLALRAFAHALRGMRSAWALALGSWASRWAIGALLVVGGALAAARLGGRAGGALAALWVVHQGVLAARVALRASWLARAARIVSP